MDKANKIMLPNVRLSFPSIFRKGTYEGKETKYEATFLLDKVEHAAKIAEIEAAIDAILLAKFGSKDKIPKRIKRTVLMDGDDKDYDGYAGKMAFKGSSNSRPLVIDRDKSPLTEEDGRIYAGCYVNASVGLWYSDYKGNEQVLGNLFGIQFCRDGEAFSGSKASVDDFDAFDDDDLNF